MSRLVDSVGLLVESLSVGGMLRTAQPQRHLLQEDLIEDCLRDQGLLMQTMQANRELLFRRDTFWGSVGMA